MSENKQIALNEQQMQVLMDELSRLQTMYLDARNNAQSVFNFYLSFVTAVVGGIVFLVQIQPAGQGDQANALVIALLFFAAMVGSVYLGALSGRYGHAARFARALDALRRQLIQISQTPLPALYDAFLNARADAAASRDAWYVWLIPTGSYQMFMSFINSAALGLMVILLGVESDSSGEAVFIAAGLVFIVTLTIYNAYSVMIIRRIVGALDVRIDMGNTLGNWAGRN